MTSLIAFSMFQDVLFPSPDVGSLASGADDLRLRRVKRFVPEPTAETRRNALVVFDLETTGLDPGTDRIIEIGAIKLVGLEPVAEFSTLVHTDLELTPEIIRLTGINPPMLVGQPHMSEVLPQFLDFISGAVLVAHNAEFDLAMLKSAASREGIDLEWPCFCTLKLAREFLPDLENRKLDTLAAHYGLSFEARHRAIGDIKVTIGVLKAMLAREAKALRSWSHFHSYAVL